MRLPLARKSTTEVNLFDKAALINCFAIVSQPESADYMVAEIKSILQEQNKLKSSAEIVAKSEEYAHYIHMQQKNKTSPWTGNTDIKTDFQNMQFNLASEAAALISTKTSGIIRMGYAVGDDSEFVRGFSFGGSTSPEVGKALDTLFNAYMAEGGFICKGSVFYEADKDGNIKQDLYGNKAVADAAKIKERIASFRDYAADRDISVAMEEQSYSFQKPAAATKKEAPQEAAVSRAAEPAAPESQETPKSPSSSRSGGMST